MYINDEILADKADKRDWLNSDGCWSTMMVVLGRWLTDTIALSIQLPAH